MTSKERIASLVKAAPLKWLKTVKMLYILIEAEIDNEVNFLRCGELNLNGAGNL